MKNKKGGMPFSSTMMILVLIFAVAFFASAFPQLSSLVNSIKTALGLDSGEAESSEYDNLPNIAGARREFQDFLDSYKECLNYKSNNCICDEFYYGSIPEEYSIALFDSPPETKISLISRENKKEIDFYSSNSKICHYDYSTGQKSQIFNFDLTDKENSDYKFENKIQLYKFDNNNVCFVKKASEREGFVGVTRRGVSCGAKDKGISLPKTKLALLDIGEFSFVGSFDGEKKASKLLEQLDVHLRDVSKVSRITEKFAEVQNRPERRTSWFNSLYEREGKEGNSLKDKVYLISIAAYYKSLKYLKEEDIKQDHFVIHYLKDSPKSKLLAEKIKEQLDSISGKYYKTGVEDKKQISEKYKLNTVVKLEGKDTKNKGPAFLIYSEEKFLFFFTSRYEGYDINKPPWKYTWKEKYEIPAVFIDVVEVDGDKHYLFEGHYGIISQKIYEGVKKYLEESK